ESLERDMGFRSVAIAAKALLLLQICVLSAVVDKDDEKPKGRGGCIAKSLLGSA
ncbi:hypothetical protein Tco_1117395, partial [Tanacetum coccineum]